MGAKAALALANGPNLGPRKTLWGKSPHCRINPSVSETSKTGGIVSVGWLVVVPSNQVQACRPSPNTAASKVRTIQGCLFLVCQNRGYCTKIGKTKSAWNL